jgi:hypothetical protein
MLNLQLLLNISHLLCIKTKVSMYMLSSPMQLMLPALICICIALRNLTMSCVWIAIHRHWVLILRETIWEVSNKDKHLDRPRMAHSTKQSALRDN